VKNNRDYAHGKGKIGWLYLSRLAALKEFAFMKILSENGFPTPVPIDCNRHSILMSYVDGYPLVSIRELANPCDVYHCLISHIINLAEHGLIHGDFNEFNLMISDEEEITIIDFPQMISTDHPLAVE
jgi:RIO kinase 2